MKKIILIDSNALIHRAFHALPPTLSSGNGVPTNAVFGFSSILLKVIKELNPEYVAATFDLPGPTFRHEQYEDYKLHRVKAPNELYDQIPLVKQVLEAIGIPIFEKKGFEADDVLATLATLSHKEKDLKVYIVTGDLDALQLVVDDRIVVYTMKKGFNDTTIYNEKAVMERYGLKPSQLSDYRGLKGDPSDNIPGVPGIGEKTGAKLIQEYGSLENLYSSIESGESEISGKLLEKLVENKDQAFFSKQLSIVVRDLDLDFDLSKTEWRNKIDKKKLEELFKEFGFQSLIRRLKELNLSIQDSLIPEETKEKAEQSLEKYFEERGMINIYETIEKPLTPVLSSMEKNGIKVDAELLKKLLVKTNSEILDLEKKIYDLAGMTFNINSPSQLANVLYDKLEIKGKIRKTAGGARSTAAPELEKVRDEHPIVDLIMQYRELQKLKTTYIEPFPSLIAPDGRIHTTYDQLGAATGRLSSSNPNLQNIPTRTEIGQEFRKAFVSEKGYKLLSADYSQIELRIVAHIAKDSKMIDAFQKGQDIHTRTASEVFDVDPNQVTKDMRRQAKVLNFGVLYGMGSIGVARAAGVNRNQGKEFIDRYFAEFDGVAGYIEKTKQEAQKNGFVQTIFGRKREIPEIASMMPQLKAQGERMAVNMPIQGTAADIIKMAMVKIYDEIKEENDIKMLLQVHDELIFEVADSAIEKYARRIKEIMENIYKFSVPIVVDLKSGSNWQEMEAI